MAEWAHKHVKNAFLRTLLVGLLDVLYIARLGLTFESIGDNLLHFFESIGGVVWLFLRSLLFLVLPPFRLREILKQTDAAGWRSIPLIGAVLGFIGLIIVLELNFQLSRVVGNTAYVPGLAGILAFREFGPTVVACMFAAKVGASWAAEISNMKISEQIDALEMSSVNPVNYLVAPRLVASAVMLFALSAIGASVALLLGWFVSRQDFSFMAYYIMMSKFTRYAEVGTLFTKALVFSPVVPVCAAWYGLRARGGARGVGEATTKAVVTSILIIIVLDFFMNSLADKLLKIVLE